MTESRLSSLRVSRGRLALVTSVVGYILVFNLTYRVLLVPVFGAWGFGVPTAPTAYLVCSFILCLVPAFWMPVQFNRPSLLFFYIQYFLIFVPAAFIVYGSVRPELRLQDALTLVLAMFAGLTIIQFAYLVPARSIRAVRLSPEAFWLFFATIAATLVLYLLIKLGSGFRLVGFQDVYELRNAMGDTLSATGSRFGLYAQSLTSSLVLPLIFATGIASRKWWTIFPVFLGYVLLFGIGGAKATALAIVYLPLAALLLSRRPNRIGTYFVLGISFALAAGLITLVAAPASVHLAYTAVVHFRFFSVPPLTIPQYFDFFQTHPVTHLSHVTGFNWLLRYPYDLDVPYTIGTYFYGGPVGLNSGLWAGDGIAGFGIWGIPLVSIICAFVFWMIDSASAEFDPAFTALALTFCTVFFGNVSLFTTLITGGLGLLLTAMSVAPRDIRGHIRIPAFGHLRRVEQSPSPGDTRFPIG